MLQVVSQFILQSIMMSLIVAWMTDTFTRVMTGVIHKSYKELNQLILRYENLCFWNRKSQNYKYLHWIEYQDIEKQDWYNFQYFIHSNSDESNTYMQTEFEALRRDKEGL